MKQAFKEMYPIIENDDFRKKQLVSKIMKYQCNIEEYVHNWQEQIAWQKQMKRIQQKEQQLINKRAQHISKANPLEGLNLESFYPLISEAVSED